MANTNCKKCGCQDKFLTPAPCPSPQGCPEPENCSEIFNAGCIEYTGTNITCDDEIIVATGDRVSDALIAIADLACNSAPLCNMQVTITSQAGIFPTLESNIVGGTAPYTYSWSIVQGPFVGHTINGVTNTADLNLDCIGPNGLQNGDNSIKISNVRLDVVDAAGCRESVYYTFASECYAVDARAALPLPAYSGGEDKEILTVALYGFDFMDDVAYMPTCDELDNLACPDLEQYDIDMTLYRGLRDTFLKDQNDNLLNNYYGRTPIVPLDYSIFEPGGLGEQLVFYKGPLKVVNLSFGCPQSSNYAWTQPLVELGGDSLEDRLPGVDLITYLPEVDLGDPLPATGLPGQGIYNTNDMLFYLWDISTTSWSILLFDTLAIYVDDERNAKRDACSKAITEVCLSTSPFVWAADYIGLHRVKKELI